MINKENIIAERDSYRTYLINSSSRILSILENIPEGFIILDFEWNISYINPAVETMFKLFFSDIASKKFSEAFKDNLSAETHQNLMNVMKSRKNLTFEEKLRDNELWIEIIAFTTPEGMSIFFKDITERKISDLQIKQMNAELESRVALRTAELEFKNTELEAFCYSVSHDLMAPLRSIDGFTEALIEDYGILFDDRAKDYISRVKRSCVRMKALIEDLLKLSRISQTEIVKTDFDISRMAFEISEKLKEKYDHNSYNVSILHDMKIFADQGLVRIVLENLLDNAFKFSMNKEHPEIIFGKTDIDGVSFFFVKDNGEGFNMKYYDRLFVPFRRLHAEEEFAGNGIGLATVKRIVTKHLGKIWAESIKKEGTTFFFNFNGLKKE